MGNIAETLELDRHVIFVEVLREIIRQLKYGMWVGGCEADPEGFIREPFTGQLIYMEPHDLSGV